MDRLNGTVNEVHLELREGEEELTDQLPKPLLTRLLSISSKICLIADFVVPRYDRIVRLVEAECPGISVSPDLLLILID